MARKITTKAFDYIDSKLKANGAAQDAIARKDARSLLNYAAEACVGIREVGGNNKGPLVQEIQKTVDNKASSEAWCMAFVQTMLAYVEKKLGVKSPIFESEHCLTVWGKTSKVQRVKSIPLPGAIIIWQHGKTTNGHTGFVMEFAGKTFEAVEGNTESGIVGDKVVRDGGGVYRTIRSTKKNGDMTIVGYLKPFAEVAK